ncbi:MAG: thioredoxin domain-containing protein [Acidobacteria bacterium]|nr:thioredoxin domain-containing protein [Acidobacteriota bacterium]
MTNRLMYVLCLIVLVDLGLQGTNLYRRYFSARPEIVSRAKPGTTMDLSGQPIQGNPQSRTVLVEFSDFECPYCTRHATSVFGELRERLVVPGKVRYAFVNTPLPIHPNAKLLAGAGICAAKQDSFWEVHDIFFGKKTKTKTEIMLVAEDLGLELEKFDECLSDPETTGQIDRNLEETKRLGINGTPGFVIGTADATGQLTIQRFVRGAQPFNVFEQAISDVSSKNAGN